MQGSGHTNQQPFHGLCRQQSRAPYTCMTTTYSTAMGLGHVHSSLGWMRLLLAGADSQQSVERCSLLSFHLLKSEQHLHVSMNVMCSIKYGCRMEWMHGLPRTEPIAKSIFIKARLLDSLHGSNKAVGADVFSHVAFSKAKISDLHMSLWVQENVLL